VSCCSALAASCILSQRRLVPFLMCYFKELGLLLTSKVFPNKNYLYFFIKIKFLLRPQPAHSKG
jgi:hypothetical protein